MHQDWTTQEFIQASGVDERRNGCIERNSSENGCKRNEKREKTEKKAPLGNDQRKKSKQ